MISEFVISTAALYYVSSLPTRM